MTLKAGAEKKKGRRVEKDAEEEEAEEGGDKKRRRRKNAKNADEEGKEKEVRFSIEATFPSMRSLSVNLFFVGVQGESKSKGKRRRKRAEDGGEEVQSASAFSNRESSAEISVFVETAGKSFGKLSSRVDFAASVSLMLKTAVVDAVDVCRVRARRRRRRRESGRRRSIWGRKRST